MTNNKPSHQYTVFAYMSDFTLCDQVSGAIEDILNETEIRNLPRPYSLVYLSFGFSWYVRSKDLDDIMLEHDVEALRIIREAYDLLDLHAIAEFAGTLCKVCSKFPQGDDLDLESIKSEISIETGRTFESREAAIYREADELVPRLSKYIRLNLDSFVDLDLSKALEYISDLEFKPSNPGLLVSIARWSKDFAKGNSGKLPNRDQLVNPQTNTGLYGINLADYNIAEHCNQGQEQRPYIQYLQPINGYLYGLRNDLSLYRRPSG